MPERERKMKKFFTILELLIVIAVVVIVITLLLPALKKAREKAVAAACIGNIRQIGFAMTSYYNDSNEMYPQQTGVIGSGSHDPQELLYWGTWQALLLPYTGESKNGKAGPLQANSGAWGIWKCGSAKGKNGQNTHWKTNYGYNSECTPNFLKTNTLPSPGRWKPISRIALLADSKDTLNASGVWLAENGFAGDDGGRERVSDRHNSGFNVYFLDGHSGVQKRIDEQGNPSRMPVWMGVYGYKNPSYAVSRTGRQLPPLY